MDGSDDDDDDPATAKAETEDAGNARAVPLSPSFAASKYD